MVYLGRPSRACQACKNRRIKCDEQKPACANCTKTGRLCPGLPEEADLIFRTENPGRKKTRKSHVRHAPETQTTEQAVSTTQSTKTYGAGLIRQTTFNHALEKAATTCFFNAFIMQGRHIDTDSGFMELAKPMFLASREGSALHLAMDALSLASLSKWPGREYLNRTATRTYSKALEVARRGLEDPNLATSNEMIETILVFSLYESTTCSSESAKSWANHVEGAAAMLISRGTDQIRDPESLLLFRAVRTQMMVNAIQQRKPMPVFPGPKGWLADLDTTDTPAAAILHHTIRLASLLAKAKPILSLRRTEETIAQVELLLEEASELTEAMTKVELSTPPEWQWRSVANVCAALDVEKIAEIEAWPGTSVMHVYKDLHSVCIRNSNRISHILCCSTLCDAVKWLFPKREVYELDPRYTSAKARLLVFVDEICASVPYHWYGEDLLRQDSSGIPRRRTASEAIGGYGLIWPLYTASNIEEVPEIQRQWLRGRFSAIGRHYGLDESKIIYNLNRGRTGANWSPLVKYGEYMGGQQGPGVSRPISESSSCFGEPCSLQDRTGARSDMEELWRDEETTSPAHSLSSLAYSRCGSRLASEKPPNVWESTEATELEMIEFDTNIALDWFTQTPEYDGTWAYMELPVEQQPCLATALTAV